jgi:16S rRNA (cytosine967-C5)-methyltransferase
VAGATVQALEKVPHRVDLVRDSTRAITSLRDTVLEVNQGDARSLTGQYSHILLDPPCSGLGALRRRPEARWAKSAEQLEGLTVLQGELLESGLGALAPGGILAYVTCSPVVEETVSIVAEALGKDHRIEVMDTPAILDTIAMRPVPGSARGSAVQLWTHRHGTDAMFVQLLRRRVES